MSGSRDQVGRLLALVPYVQARTEVPLEEAARQLGVGPAQLVKDLQVLWMCGLPGLMMGDLIEVDFDALEGEGVLRVSNADYLRRPLRLGATEASALIVALRTLRDHVEPDVREVVDRTLRKLEYLAEDGADLADRVDVHVEDDAAQTASLRRLLEDAVEGGRRVRLDYWTSSRDETTRRDVDPVAVLSAEGRAYLDGWCHLAEGRRLFRLDRVTDVAVLDEPGDRPDLAPRDLSEGLFLPPAEAAEATLRLAPAARWVAEYYPVSSVREAEDGGLEVVLQSGDPRWLVRLVLRLAPHAVVLAPAALAEAVTAEARRTLGHYA